MASGEAGAVATQAEVRKYSKYCHLDSSYTFVPVAIETSGAMGPRSTEFLRELGYRLRQATGEVKSSIYLLQRLSVAIQRGNSASGLGTISLSDAFEDFPYFYYHYYFYFYLLIVVIIIKMNYNNVCYVFYYINNLHYSFIN